MKKTVLFWLMFVLAIAIAVYFAVRIITALMAPRINLDALAAQVAGRPELARYAVRKLPNGRIATRAQVHKSVAQWTDGVMFFPLTADGTIVNRPTDTRANNTILFRGRLPDDITPALDSARGLAAHIDYMEWIENRRWNVVTTNGAVIKLPESDAPGAFKQLESLHANNKILDRNIRMLDMRDTARILVK
jgi:cell division protein FtsQ